MLVRQGRFGPYVQLGRAEGKGKPKSASLFASMSPETITLEEALRLLSLPRVVGRDPGTGEEILARNGKYGPYLERGEDTRSLDSEEQIFTVTLDEALARLAAPKTRRGARQAAAGPLALAGGGPRDRLHHRGARRPLRAVRDRRGGQRLAAAPGLGRATDPGAGPGPAGGAARAPGRRGQGGQALPAGSGRLAGPVSGARPGSRRRRPLIRSRRDRGAARAAPGP